MALKEFIGENRLAQVLTLLKNHIMTGATSSTAGASGFVPAPSAGDQDDVLYGDGNWSPVATQMTWAQYQALPTATKRDGRVRIITDRGHTEYAEPMTWAEYQALSEQEKNDGTYRVITDRNMSPILAEGQTAIDTEGIVTTAGGTTNTQALLDELADRIVTSASDVPYSNTTSGLTATDVQAAVDEIAGDFDGLLKITKYTKTGRSDSGGNLLLSSSAHYLVVCAWETSGSYICVPFVNIDSDTGTKRSYVKVLNYNMQPVTATDNITVEFYALD